VVVEFELNVDVKTAVQDVRDKVAQARRQFNRDVGEPPCCAPTTTTTSRSSTCR
jgi:multidrug efflux pump subunit AcrB